MNIFLFGTTFLDSFEEIHYATGFTAIGIIIGIAIMLVVFKIMQGKKK